MEIKHLSFHIDVFFGCNVFEDLHIEKIKSYTLQYLCGFKF